MFASIRSRSCLLSAVMWAYCAVASAESSAPLTFGIHPYLPANELTMRFQPLTEYLGRAIGQSIIIRIGSDYDGHIKAVGAKSVDIAFMGPGAYVKLVDEYGQRPLLARLEVNGKPELIGAIVVRNDSPLQTIADLKGRSFAFGDPSSTMSHLVPQHMMAEAGVPLSSLSGYKFLGAHKNVALGVLAGDYDAGAVKIEVFNEIAPRGLRLLAKTPGVSEHLLVARPGMPAKTVETLREALLNLKQAPEGGQVMTSIQPNLTGFVPVADTDYTYLRSIMRSAESGK